MTLKDFWYIIAASPDLQREQVIGARLFDEGLAVFRDQYGKAVALEDRCLHRCAPLSQGTVKQGQLHCAYHGWVYDGEGCVVRVPSEGERQASPRRARRFAVCERDDYVYARLLDADEEEKPASPSQELQPFRIPFYQAKGWASIRLQHLFPNNVTNCVENFVDIPHTAFVHTKIFRVSRNEKLTATVQRQDGAVRVTYQGERANLGIFSWFLNRRGQAIHHTDAFFMPNITRVDYRFAANRRFIITSQSVPLSDTETKVYTDLTYNYGLWNHLARPLIRWQAQKIIAQDIEILSQQMRVINKYGRRFANTEADVIHIFIESIREALAQGEDPRRLPERQRDIEFWV
ncbi:MAG: aromatic ring-hydroxylating dioxygenase subunit alpha [Acidobacteria bacterium]|nr:aromatic ring-hydroxylating dioxygenase subunit alpha [Acidobacteriota bacterium]